MSSSAIRCKWAQVNLSKTTKLREPLGQVQFVVFEKFTSAYYTKLQEKSCECLLILYMKKYRRESRQTKFWKRARAICNCTRVTTLHSCYMGMPTFSANQRRVITYLCINACGKNRATAISTVIAFIYVVTKLEVKNSKRINAKLSAVVDWRISLFECLSALSLGNKIF